MNCRIPAARLIRKNQGAITYLHGGYDGIFPLVETALQGKSVGDKCRVTLEADDAFGEYEANMMRTDRKICFRKTFRSACQFRRRDRGLQRLHPLHR